MLQSELLTPAQLLASLQSMPSSSAPQQWLLNHFVSLKQMRGAPSAPAASQSASLQLDFYDGSQTAAALAGALAKGGALPPPWAAGQAFKLAPAGARAVDATAPPAALSAAWLPISHTAPKREPQEAVCTWSQGMSAGPSAPLGRPPLRGETAA